MSDFRTTAPGAPAAAAPSNELVVGDQVKHPTFGIGTIMYKYGEGENTKVDVMFAEEGQKKLLLKLAKLKKVVDPTATPEAAPAP